MIWFTSDWHFGDDRLGGETGKPNIFYRPTSDLNSMDQIIFKNFFSNFKNGDTLYHLGDVFLGDFNFKFLASTLKASYPDSKFILIIGNYDEDKLDVLSELFSTICSEMEITLSDGTLCYLNHYPTKCLEYLETKSLYDMDYSPRFLITGHIHSLWKVQRNMVNVGVDSWNFTPVDEDTIIFCKNAIEKYYDKNVFPYN